MTARPRTRTRAAWVLGLAWCVGAALAGQGTVRSQGELAAGTPWATPWFVQDTGAPGPTVLVVGGVHGDEPAGARAAAQIRHWTLTRGRLVVVPRANERSLQKGERLLPTASDRDLNRDFPTAADDPPRGELATALWRLACDVRPDWLLCLHESAGFRRQEPKRTGNSVIHDPSPATAATARRMTDAADETVAEADRKFVLLRPPAVGSLARAAAERLGSHALILETTVKEPPLSLRTRQHRVMVHRLLSDLGMVSGGADVLLPLTRGHDEVRIALYDAAGVGGSGPKRLERAFRDQPGSWLERVGPAEIQAGALRQFDVLICPGGSAHVQARALTPAGCREIRDFVAAGRGYVGFCAGAYLAASNYTWSLGILDANVVDRAHWQRGKGLVQIELTPEGQRLLGATATTFEVRYANGPLLEPGGRPDVPDFAPLAYYRGEVAKNGAPKGVMPNTPAMVAGTWGRGRVFVSSPHPESTPGLDDDLVRHAVRWAAGR